MKQRPRRPRPKPRPAPRTSRRPFEREAEPAPAAPARAGRRGERGGGPKPEAETPASAPRSPGFRRAPAVEGLHVAAVETLARAVVDTAEAAERAVFDERRRADRAIALALRPRRDLAAPDHRFVAQAVFALFRWHGWV